MRIRVSCMAAVLAIMSLAAVAAEIGDPAPPLKVDEWVKGGPVALADGKGKNIYIVGFWATWCPPCRASIPHLTRLQKEYRDKGVVVIGITSSDPDLETVKSFVEKQGDAMSYAVAYESRSNRATAKAYMDAYRQEGIPTAFIVDKEGRIVWVGHPMRLDEPLKQVVAGTFDMEAFKKEFSRQFDLEKARQEVMGLVGEYFELAEGGDDEDKMRALGSQVYEKISDDAEFLDLFSWHILTGDDRKLRDTDLALKAAETAIKLSKGRDASIVDTYARALWDTGQKEAAVREQRKAVELAGENAEMKAELAERLKQYEADLPAAP